MASTIDAPVGNNLTTNESGISSKGKDTKYEVGLDVGNTTITKVYVASSPMTKTFYMKDVSEKIRNKLFRKLNNG